MRRLVLLWFSCSVAFGQGTFTIERALSAPFASEPVAAPSGARVAWLQNEQGRRNVWVAAGPEWNARKVTAFADDDGQDLGDLAWAPDGETLFFVRGGDFENGGENPNPGAVPQRPDQSIWSVRVDGGTAQKVTEGKAPAIDKRGEMVAFLRGGQIFAMRMGSKEAALLVKDKGVVSDLRWSPGGTQLAFTSWRHDHGFVGIYTIASKALRYLDPSTDFDGEASWSADGKRLAFVRMPSAPEELRGPRREGEPWSIRVLDAETGMGREVFRAERGNGSVFRAIVGAAQLLWVGEKIVFPWEKDGWCHLYRIELASGKPELLTPGVGEVEHVALARDGKTVYYSSNIDQRDRGDIDRRHLFRINAESGAKPQQVTEGEGIEWAPTPTGDGSALVYLAASVSERAHAVVREANGQSLALAAEAVPETYAGKLFVKPAAVTVTAADGLELHGQLFLPGGAKGERHPALIFFHGGSRRQMLLGSHYMYYYSNAYAMNQYLASRGYVVLSVNYRSGIGYGMKFREALHYGLSGASEFNDVMGAGLYMKARADVDPRRIGLWGGSYGGYLTALGLARASDLFAAGVDFHGVHDWSAFLSGRADSGNLKRQREVSDHWRVAFESSPMAAIDSWRSPVLLIHGDDDRNVEFEQTVMLAAALRERRVPYQELIFPNEIHDFLLHRSWVKAYAATAAFFDQQFGGGH